jgi:hypothetical protein
MSGPQDKGNNSTASLTAAQSEKAKGNWKNAINRIVDEFLTSKAVYAHGSSKTVPQDPSINKSVGCGIGE